MIGCDFCEEWFHPDCLKLSKTEVKTLMKSQWACPNCESDEGISSSKIVLNWTNNGVGQPKFF